LARRARAAGLTAGTRRGTWTRRPAAAAVTGNAAVTLAAGAGGLRSTLGDDGLVCFLVLLVVLLVMALTAVIRLPPEAARPAAQDGQPEPQQPASQATQVRRLTGPMAGIPQQLPVRVGMAGQAGYAARHGFSPPAAREDDTARLPKVSGGPPWGPAPRPPGL
jgi:hypothetical protein